jgi:hypothetical protein
MANITADRVIDLKHRAEESGDDYDEISYMEALESLSAREYARFTTQSYGWSVTA